ncbi:MAG TPA: aminoglycoside phosphotransferase family protein [Herpetosiphonaceae bacterium]
MRQLPKLTDADIRAAVLTHYDLSLTALDFLPIGNDLLSFVYRAETGDGTSYLLKLRAERGFRAPSLIIPRFFYEQGIPHIVAPVPSSDQRLWVEIGSYALMLYPFLDARTAAAAGLSKQHWQALGTTLQQIHTSQLPPELRQMLRQETFIPWRRELLTEVEAIIAGCKLSNTAQHELAEFWRSRQDEIRAVIERADTLGAQLRRANLPLVLCHADLHTWNMLLDSAGQLWIIDWDEMILAPKERDLMFVIGGIGRDLVSAEETASFLQGYDDAAIDQRALTYYRYAWAVQDMGAYVEEVFFTPDLGAEDRSDSVRGFITQFAPGNIVDIARASDTGF